ncbi:MAG: M28 family peptidase [Planctomycetes bacterium]|nr:M28 family peptidase [Planctomycetota bacterium]
MTRDFLFPILLGCALGACASSGTRRELRKDLAPALASLSADDLMAHVRVLASDEFEGRGPGTEGDEKTVEYLVSQFRSIGLEPGNPDGSFVQRVPLMGFETSSRVSFTTPSGTLELERLKDYVAISRLEHAELAGLELVFVGYGTVAPEYGWDDYKDVDVRGKAIVMLVNDPPVPDSRDPAQLDATMFRGKAMTYYGRWTYKYEIAKAKGAAAAILVHETGPAGYPWEVISGSWGREGFDIAGPSSRGGAADAHVPVESWIQREVALKLCAESGLDFEQLRQQALARDFRPVAVTGARANFDCRAKIRNIESSNVVALRRGSHPDNKDELVVLTAHWDHLGKDPSREGDQIFNGALDNASGTSALLELAQASMLVDPARSILFLAVTAEEKGLLGSKYYAAHPLYPLARTVANINMDGLNPYGRTLDVVNIGQGFSTLDEIVARAAAAQGRRIEPDAEPEKGFYFRSDHFSFVKQGVPALYAESGVEYRGRPEGWGRAQRERYTAEDYHKPSDEIRAGWDLSGAMEDVALYLRVAWEVSEADAWPEWKPGSEFKSVREAMLRAAR